MTPPARTGQAPVLLCPDILLEILNHLEPGRRTLHEKKITVERRVASRGALRACALTCRTLLDPALDVLWRALDDAQPLLKLLAAHKHPIVLKPHVTPEVWTKLQSYATRVREIGPFLNPPSTVHPSAWMFLSIHFGSSPLLPRLQDLDAQNLSLDDFSPLFMLLSSPSLHSLSLSFKEEKKARWGNFVDPSPVAILTLPHIAQLAPNLKRFHMSGRHSFTHKHLLMLRGFDGLTELSLGSGFLFNGAMLHQLSTMTSLRALSITLAHHGPDSVDLGPLSRSLRSLYKLTLGGFLEDLVTFILACQLPLLDALALQVKSVHWHDPTSFGAPFASICRHPGLPTSLTTFRCEFPAGIKVQRQETLLHYFEPLLSFSMIEDCELIFCHTLPGPSVCDEDLLRLGDAWHNLRRLNIRQTFALDSSGAFWAYSPEAPPEIQYPTVFGLTELARRCPVLRYVHLVAIDASLLPQTDAASRLGGHPLRELMFQHVHNTALSSEKRCATAEVLFLAFSRLDIALSKAECDRLSTRPNTTQSQWKSILLLVWAQQCRSSQDWSLLESNFGSAARRAVSMKSEKSLAELDAALAEAYSTDLEPYWDSEVLSSQGSDSGGEWIDPSESDG